MKNEEIEYFIGNSEINISYFTLLLVYALDRQWSFKFLLNEVISECLLNTLALEYVNTCDRNTEYMD